MKEIKICEEIFLKLSGLYYSMLPAKAVIKVGKKIAEEMGKAKADIPLDSGKIKWNIIEKLYENIEDINIKGGVGQLSEMVRAMDISLQNIANNTDQLVGYLVKYSASNKGAQYEKVVSTSMYLRDEMFDASVELNDMQNQIVTYQNKIYRYEDMAESASRPNPYLVTKRQISVDTSIVQFNRADMQNVSAALRNYSERVILSFKNDK